jgi:hypothetical protein
MTVFNKKVYFVIANKWTGTAYSRGLITHDYLSSKGYDTYCLEGYTHDMSSVTDSIVIFIKHHNPQLAQRLKKQNNKVVLDVLDGYSTNTLNVGVLKSPDASNNTGEFIKDYFDSYILSTKRLLQDVKGLMPEGAFGHVIYEKFDPKLEKYKEIFDARMPPHDKPKIGYIGASENIMHYDNMYIKENIQAVFDFKEQTRMSPLYNCHYSVRVENSEDFLYKPTSKISTAAAVNANIIHTRDACAIEVAGPDYPYYTDSNLENVMETVEYVKATYNTPTWNQGLEIMAEVKEKLHIDRICGEKYPEFFRRLCDQ